MSRMLETIVVSIICCSILPAAIRADEVRAGGQQYLRGLAMLEQGQWSSAIREFTGAIAVNRTDADYFVARGVAYTLFEQLSQALHDLQTANRLRPEHPTTKLWLASALAMQGRLGEDEQVFPVGSQDPHEAAVRATSRQYGNAAQRRDRSPQDGTAIQLQAGARLQFRRLASQFVARVKPGGNGGKIDGSTVQALPQSTITGTTYLQSRKRLLRTKQQLEQRLRRPEGTEFEKQALRRVIADLDRRLANSAHQSNDQSAPTSGSVIQPPVRPQGKTIDELIASMEAILMRADLDVRQRSTAEFELQQLLRLQQQLKARQKP